MALRSLLPFQTRALGAMGGDPFLTLHRELNRVFDDVFRSSGGIPGGSATAMAPMHMDVTEDDKEIRIIGELPGVAENDVQVELNDDVLTIRGEKRSEYEDAQHHVRERSFGVFSRSIQLPFAVDPNRLEASFNNGVLTVSVPKAAAQQQAHRIQIKAGQPGPATIQGQSGQATIQGQSGQASAARGGAGTAGSGQSGAASGSSGKATNLPPGQGPSGV